MDIIEEVIKSLSKEIQMLEKLGLYGVSRKGNSIFEKHQSVENSNYFNVPENTTIVPMDKISELDTTNKFTFGLNGCSFVIGKTEEGRTIAFHLPTAKDVTNLEFYTAYQNIWSKFLEHSRDFTEVQVYNQTGVGNDITKTIETEIPHIQSKLKISPYPNQDSCILYTKDGLSGEYSRNENSSQLKKNQVYSNIYFKLEELFKSSLSPILSKEIIKDTFFAFNHLNLLKLIMTEIIASSNEERKKFFYSLYMTIQLSDTISKEILGKYIEELSNKAKDDWMSKVYLKSLMIYTMIVEESVNHKGHYYLRQGDINIPLQYFKGKIPEEYTKIKKEIDNLKMKGYRNSSQRFLAGEIIRKIGSFTEKVDNYKSNPSVKVPSPTPSNESTSLEM